MARMSDLIKPAAWILYVVIVFEILFMISPFALHFYAAYGPALNFLHQWPVTTWLAQFYLPHFTETTSPLLNAAHIIGMLLVVGGLVVFFAGAIPIYWSKFRQGSAVIGGIYSFIRHPQYVGLAIAGVGAALVWPRFLVLITLVVMILLYTLLAEWEEQLCADKFGDAYREYQQRTGRFLPKWIGDRFPRIVPVSGVRRVVVLSLLVPSSVAVAVGAGMLLRDWSLTRIAAIFAEDTAVISTAYIGDEDLEASYRIARSDPRVQDLLGQTPAARFIVYVVPSEWFLPDLPLDTVNLPGGHHVPPAFDHCKRPADHTYRGSVLS